MLLYSIIMFLCAAAFAGMGIAIYRGKTDLIHDYHQTKVTDKEAYGKAFGKSMLVIAAALFLSGVISLHEDYVPLAVAILFIGLIIGIVLIALVQRKYNKGIF